MLLFHDGFRSFAGDVLGFLLGSHVPVAVVQVWVSVDAIGGCASVPFFAVFFLCVRLVYASWFIGLDGLIHGRVVIALASSISVALFLVKLLEADLGGRLEFVPLQSRATLEV